MIDKPDLKQPDQPFLFELDEDFKKLDTCTQLILKYMVDNKIAVLHLRNAIEKCLPTMRKELKNSNSEAQIFSNKELCLLYECFVVDFIHIQLAKKGKVWSGDHVKSIA